ncbi:MULTISPECIES: hypothetical protein [Pseudomonas fluorescens group]|uniref:hypothetical protein n=1 Tax=Pseudomonas fluorescens group TaxID=136843 RepID=UPI001594EEE9|nr:MULTISPECIES: hypothetical protein [Pseudomonas fluorescens group]MCP1515660.1 hypothetical protein [Pseudomonas rhodesiae]MDF9772907.1 hypothetical protein [Pseudomonas rhodesiae]
MKIVPYIALVVSLGALYLAWEARENEVPKIAVINIAAAIEAIPGERTPEAIEEATSKTYQQAARLAARGFLVLDSRAAIQVPADMEVPLPSFSQAPEQEVPQ